MSQQVTADKFVSGNLTMFTYHDTLRMGKVDHVGTNRHGKQFVVVEFEKEHPVHKTKFQAFSFDKISLVS